MTKDHTEPRAVKLQISGILVLIGKYKIVTF